MLPANDMSRRQFLEGRLDSHFRMPLLLAPQPRHLVFRMHGRSLHAAARGAARDWCSPYPTSRRCERFGGRHARPTAAVPEGHVGVMHVVFPSRRGMIPAVRALLDLLSESVRLLPS
jgi:hypothetical protein